MDHTYEWQRWMKRPEMKAAVAAVIGATSYDPTVSTHNDRQISEGEAKYAKQQKLRGLQRGPPDTKNP